MARKRLFAGVMLFVSCVVLSPAPVLSQPVRDRILGDVHIEDRDECALVRIGFAFPVRYLRHFPENAGDELRIHLEPIAVNPQDKGALTRREAIKPPHSDIAPLSEVVYEGDITGGPYLTLTFTHPVQFRVAQGPDFRSLVIAVPLPETDLPCEPVFGKGKSLPGK